jgi:ABC-type amino acid transport substrate-binding protein
VEESLPERFVVCGSFPRMRSAAVLAIVVSAFAALAALATLASPAVAQPAQPEPPASPPAQAPEAPPGRKLVVATHPVAPFIIKNADGSWSGISMDLWAALARELKLEYEVRELPIKDLLELGTTHAADVIVSLNITAERERELDLTQAFYSTGLAIAVAPHKDTGIVATMKKIFTAQFGKLVGLLFLVLAAVGTLMWLIERKRNHAQFGGTPVQGIASGLWWSAVTMTTVGYGDKSPVTLVGRMLGLVWMFTALIIISSFTAAIAAALTVSQLSSSINGPDDLPKARIGTVEPSAGAKYCTRHSLAFTRFPDASAAVAALAKGELDAVVYEAPILQYTARTEAAGKVVVLGGTFDNHGYGFGLMTGSTLREPLDQALLAYTTTDDWSAILERYLGKP